MGDYCSAVLISHKLEYSAHKHAAGNRITLRNREGRIKTVDLPSAEIGDKTLIKDLRKAGMLIGMGAAGPDILTGLASEANPDKKVEIVDSSGWYKDTYITPQAEVIGDADGIELNIEKLPEYTDKGGTLEGQIAAYDAALRCGNPHLALGVYSGFAGVILQLCDMHPCSMAFTGETSRGKSTAQKLGASAFSDPRIGRGLFKTMRSTGNALETVFQAGNGASIHLDEWALLKGEELNLAIFMLATGSGKLRLNSSAEMKQVLRWTTFATLSGETGLAQKIETSDSPMLGGIEVRCVEIGVDDAVTLSRDTISAIDRINRNFGHTGPVFVRCLIDKGYHIRPDLLEEEIEKIVIGIAGEDARPAETRLVRVLALLWRVGELAQEAGLIASDLDVAEPIKWAWRAVEDMKEEGRLDGVTRGLNRLKKSINLGSGVVDLALREREDGLTYKDKVAFVGHGVAYIPIDNLVALCGGGVTKKMITDRLKALDVLVVPENEKEKRLYHRSIPLHGPDTRGIKVDHYQIKICLFEDDDSSNDDDDSVFDGDAKLAEERAKAPANRRGKKF